MRSGPEARRVLLFPRLKGRREHGYRLLGHGHKGSPGAAEEPGAAESSKQ